MGIEAGGDGMGLNSQQLQFGSDGRSLAWADPNGVTVVGFEPTRVLARIEQRGVSALALFPQQVWMLDENRAHVSRFHCDGRPLESKRRLPVAPCSVWLVPTVGVPAVLVEGEGRQLLVEHFEQLVEIPVPSRGVAFPLSGRRYVVCQDGLVRFGGGITTQLLAGVTPLGGAALFGSDKRLVMLVKDEHGRHGAVVLDTENGKVQRQFNLAEGASRIAACRGIIVVHTSERRFAIFDVKGARSDVVVAPVDVDDFAVDTAGKRIAIRSTETISIYPLERLAPSARPELELTLEVPRAPADRVAPRTRLPALDTASATAATRPLCTPSFDAAPASNRTAAPLLKPLPVAVGASPSEVTLAVGTAATPPRFTTPSHDADSLPIASVRNAVSAPRASGSEPPLFGGTGSHIGRQTQSGKLESAPPIALDDARRGRPHGLDAPVRAPVVDLYKVRGFGPAPKRVNVTRHEAARMLSGELRSVELRTLLAITRAWDSGRIAYANASQHPQELEAMAIVGVHADGNAREQVAAAQAEWAAHEQAMANDPSRRAESTPLGAIAAEFQLSPLAIDILMVAVAPTIRGEIGRLYGILANDPARPRVDELLIEQILGDTEEARCDIAYELGPNGALCRYGIIQVADDRPRPHAALTVDPVIVAWLRAEPVNFGPGAVTTVRAADRALHELLVPDELLLGAMRYLSQPPDDEHQARIVVRGPAGSGRRTLLAALAQRAGRDLGLIDLKRLPRSSDAFTAALRTELRRSLLRGLVPCLVHLDEVCTGNEDPLRDLVQDILRTHAGPVAVHLAPRARVPLDPGYLLLDLETPTESQRLSIWRQALSEKQLPTDAADVLAARYRVGPGTIRRTVRAVADARREQGRLAGDALADLETHLRQVREIRLGDKAKRVERLADWSSLVLPEDTEYSLRELISRIRHARTVMDEWGFDRVLSSGRGLTALFEGPPGTGKTLVAGAIAKQLGLDLYKVDLSTVTSKWLGETEKNLSAIFDGAEDGQVILLFDEADSLFAKRGEVKSSNDRFANQEVNYLLQRLDSFEGFAILTTNFGRSIDPAFKRRLSFRLTFPFPDVDARVQLWRVHLPRELPTEGVLDLHALAQKYELSGGYIRNACVRAAYLAAEDGTPLRQEHLERAVALEYTEMGKLSRDGRLE